MIISIIIMYLLGVFFAYLAAGYANDLNGIPYISFVDCTASYLSLIAILVHIQTEYDIGENKKLSYPSLNKFLKIFKQTKSNERQSN